VQGTPETGANVGGRDTLAAAARPAGAGHPPAPATGPLVAVDLDGVLECDPLGYPATSPSGALAVRALIAHGYRPVAA